MAELKKIPILILRFDGECLKEFLASTQFDPEMINIFSQIEARSSSLRESIMMALEQLTVDHGLPPSSDSWVFDNIVDPALQILSVDQLEQPASEENFLKEFKKFICDIIKRLQEQPVIVAHTEKTFDGGGIRRLLSNKFELNKLLDLVWRDLQKESNVFSARRILQVALDRMATSADLPCYGTVDQVDTIVNEIFKLVDEKEISQLEQFKKIMTDILGNIMLQLEGNPISISSNSVVHEPLTSPSTVLPSSSLSPLPEIE
ncbi:uncharacterized protein LOC110107641 isoform X1 [Dendrobium catenatum]|uniref:Uncharacterized protein n=2 Tax=Dendrobium catenatum TaxID=906689 RepID=A0A2I0WNJ1_9ASPA|nr:uncharacterized protein LOC110107641 isoform X1 [Dendrobium catenatum]XP_020693607.1 uncharacterized protein LOC110107641 isoform X1 [Dendrobium catenatum]XP_020693608.1 uncharacterized protein LOC110107641 isoform X1 [Dendrobium catenatum]XP_020693609.1 uncharacterized protein LOC110107641 isoform X1 [Dendrobium catenatum]PKU77201.1 hypothetical protein MA16_Dca013237 [Dendrobium catenatum]